MNLRERYEAKIDRSGGTDACHPWTGSLNNKGYGLIFTGSKKDGTNRASLAHRIGWELSFGPIPNGLLVLHKCDNRPCQNENHWFLGTDADNMTDMIVKGRAIHEARLTDADVREIRLARCDGESCKSIAQRFGVTAPYISRIALGTRRKNPSIAGESWDED